MLNDAVEDGAAKQKRYLTYALQDILVAFLKTRDEPLRRLQMEGAALLGQVLATAPGGTPSEHQIGQVAGSLLDLNNEQQIICAVDLLTLLTRSTCRGHNTVHLH